MTDDALLLIGRDTGHTRAVLETHADRLGSRADLDRTAVATVGTEPERDLAAVDIDADRTFAVPMWFAHTHCTESGVPAGLRHLDGPVHYCEPVGRSPSVTGAIADRAAAAAEGRPDSVALVAFGSSSKPNSRLATEYHAARLREREGHDEVVPCYLLQNPTAECVRYTLAADRSVAVPLFLGRSEATERRIPEALDLDRGGLDYAAPLGDHEGVTTAVASELARVREAVDDRPAGASDTAVGDPRVTLADGDGTDAGDPR